MNRSSSVRRGLMALAWRGAVLAAVVALTGCVIHEHDRGPAHYHHDDHYHHYDDHR